MKGGRADWHRTITAAALAACLVGVGLKAQLITSLADDAASGGARVKGPSLGYRFTLRGLVDFWTGNDRGPTVDKVEGQ